MIWNIIDRRERCYRWQRINAVIEAVEHDNTCADADQAAPSNPATTVDYEEIEGIPLAHAIAWAGQAPCPVTLYLYDEGRGTRNEEHFHAVSKRL